MEKFLRTSMTEREHDHDVYVKHHLSGKWKGLISLLKYLNDLVPNLSGLYDETCCSTQRANHLPNVRIVLNQLYPS
jgi:hypothetical protein